MRELRIETELTSVGEDSGGEGTLKAPKGDSPSELVDGGGDGRVLEGEPGRSRPSVDGLVLQKGKGGKRGRKRCKLS